MHVFPPHKGSTDIKTLIHEANAEHLIHTSLLSDHTGNYGHREIKIKMEKYLKLNTIKAHIKTYE